jgi:hypothetical protein
MNTRPSMAGPEDRYLVRDGIAIIRSTQIGDPDGVRTADVEGGAMGMRIARGQLAGHLDQCCGDRPHCYHHRSMEAAGRTAGQVGEDIGMLGA